MPKNILAGGAWSLLFRTKYIQENQVEFTSKKSLTQVDFAIVNVQSGLITSGWPTIHELT